MATVIQRVRGADRARHERLEELLSQQGTFLRYRKQILRDDVPTETSGVTDVEELSQDAEVQGVGFSVLELTSQTVQGLETALQRLEAGAFGTCPGCGRPIGEARLRALPFAALCLACQESHDLAAAAASSRTSAGWRARVAATRIGTVGA